MPPFLTSLGSVVLPVKHFVHWLEMWPWDKALNVQVNLCTNLPLSVNPPEAESPHSSRSTCSALLSIFTKSALLASRAFCLPFPSPESPVPASLGGLQALGQTAETELQVWARQRGGSERPSGP